MKRIILAIIILTSTTSFAQQIINNIATAFQIKNENDSIDFIIYETDLSKKKPVFLYLQGSTPQPLFIKFDDGKTECLLVTPFDYKEIIKKYHLVIISKPGIPLLATQKETDKNFCFIENPDQPDPLNFPLQYLKGDFLENYVNRAQLVLKFLEKKEWVDNSKLIVAGHSEGANIAPKLALINKHITHLGLFSPNPFGRIEQSIRKARKDATLGKISWEKADSIMQNEYAFLKMIYAIKDIDRETPSLKSWKSFSKPSIDDWLQIEIPIFVAYGTDDIVSDLCDVVPLYFVREGKNNLDLKRYLHMNHSFFEINEGGNINYNKWHFKDVMNDFLIWVSKE